MASIEAKRNFWLASTDLSVAVLGGGSFASEPDAVIAADERRDRRRLDKDQATMLSRRNFLGGSAVALASVAAISGRGQAAGHPGGADHRLARHAAATAAALAARTISRW